MLQEEAKKLDAFGDDNLQVGEGVTEIMKDLTKRDHLNQKYSLVKRVGLYRTLELAACTGDYAEQSRVKEKYRKILENLSDFILDENATGDNFKFKWLGEIGSFPVTEALKKYLIAYRDTLMSAGYVRRTEYPPQCIITGRVMQPGELFLQLGGGSPEAISLSACDDGNVIDVNTVVCCYVQE